MLDNHGKFIQTPQPDQPNPRLTDTLRYCALRSLEMDMGYASNTLIMNPFERMLAGFEENKPMGGGHDVI